MAWRIGLFWRRCDFIACEGEFTCIVVSLMTAGSARNAYYIIKPFTRREWDGFFLEEAEIKNTKYVSDGRT